LRKLSRISINKFRADEYAPVIAELHFRVGAQPLTLLIAATPRTVARRFPTKLTHLVLTLI